MIVDFLFNLAMIITYVLLTSRLKEHLVEKNVDLIWIKYSITLSSAIFAFFVMLLPLHLEDNYFDFRSIPLFLVSYIWGIKYGALAGVLPTIYRTYLGGDILIGLIFDIFLPIVIGGLFNNSQKKNSRYVFIDIKRTVLIYFFMVVFHFCTFGLIEQEIVFLTWLKLFTLFSFFSVLTLILAIILLNDSNEIIYKNIVEYDKLDKELNHTKLTIKLFGQLSHELKTPLNLIFSALHLLNLNIVKLDDHKALKFKKYAGTIKQNSFRLLKIVNNLVDITRINTDSYKIRLENVDIVDVVRKIVLSLGDYMEEQERVFQFKTKIEKKVIACAPLEIERIMLNLLSNAVKFTDKGNEISVIVDQLKDYIKIIVKDTGIGIKEEDKELFFGEFKQVDKSLHRNREGSGLGLSIVKSLVELHGGEIKLESQYGKGSEFIIFLPIRIVEEDKNHVNIYEDILDRVEVEFSDIYHT